MKRIKSTVLFSSLTCFLTLVNSTSKSSQNSSTACNLSSLSSARLSAIITLLAVKKDFSNYALTSETATIVVLGALPHYKQ